MASRGVVEAARKVLGDGDESDWQARLREAGTVLPVDQKDVRLALTAFGYDAAYRAGSRSPNEDVAAAFGVAMPEVRRWVSDARLKGFLSGGGQRGHMGGEATRLAAGAVSRAAKDTMGIEDSDRPLYVIFEGLSENESADEVAALVTTCWDQKAEAAREHARWRPAAGERCPLAIRVLSKLCQGARNTSCQ